MKVMIFSDTHMPFTHKNYVKFLKDQKELYKPDKVICCGDLVDHHALSNFIKDPDGASAGDEWKQTKEMLSDLFEVFPEVEWIIGNHDRRPYIKAYNNGMPGTLIRPLNEIYECPPGWTIQPDLELEGVKYIHGEGAGGQSGWQNLCNFENQSVVFGHMHSVGGVRYHQNSAGEQKFSMGVGCGVDQETYAFAYGRHHKNKPLLGCGFVTDGWDAQFLPMNLKTRRYKGYKKG